MKTLLRYCVGLDVSKDSLQVCLAVIDSDGRVTVKASTKVANKASSFAALVKWVGGHCCTSSSKSGQIGWKWEETIQ